MLRRKMAAAPSPLNCRDSTCSSFTSMLVNLSNSLTTENISTLKLFLGAEKILQMDDIEEIQHGSDVLRLLLRERRVGESDCKLLVHMLSVIGRVDLSKITQTYVDSVNVRAYQEHNLHDSPKTEIEMKMSVDEDGESQTSSQSSSVSMTDEEKLLQIKLQELEPTCSQDLFESTESLCF